MVDFFYRQNHDCIARDATGPIFSRQLTCHIASISHQLIQQHPNATSVINLCSGRLNFLRGFFAVINAGLFNLLPPNKQPSTLLELAADYPNSILLHDGLLTSDFPNPVVDIRQLNLNALPEGHLNTLDNNSLAAVSFTSGSSGKSQPVHKTWSVFKEGALINARNMLIRADENLNILATVPPHHMYGLEITVLLSIVSPVCICNGQPLLPSDVLRDLNATPEPRALVSTPQHFKALMDSGLNFPVVSRLYSATAPLPQALAQEVEERFNGELIEIYGCSEMGSVARRRTAQETEWTPFDAMSFEFGGEHNTSTVSAPHVSAPVELQDILKPGEDGCFTLHGRMGDMIKIAGIRGSLAELNQRLLAVAGVQDGIVFLPEPDEHGAENVQRLAAIVVSDSHSRGSLTEQLNKHVHPALLPRPILFTDVLPRSDTSKLPRAELLALFQKLMAKHRH